ncbi:hypothetical protein [Phaeovulum vinaykumarii]|uniref:50S ribosomal protein L35 n=1 Tax=Phaeovulum vinaykumarii TaxID=407234 RepID=A0A1N7ML37_9RHOB|nr:hypothetical protein [Phaeovulum vinaykumarii]SIS86732.1 hypothetical protein SAMN05421795_10833 [Phaeovulum vinaykumarii]SOC13441.1 hypothetical protein SAMN05878426_108113 [Phaeovulum vinaykumarii]
MESDVFLVLGLVIAAFSIPAMLSSLSGGHSPRGAAVSIVSGGCLILMAMVSKPGGYAPDDVPDVFARVVQRAVAEI